MHNRRHNKVEFRGNRNLRRRSISTGIRSRRRRRRRSRSTKQTFTHTGMCVCVRICVFRIVKFVLYNSQLPRYDFRLRFFLISQLSAAIFCCCFLFYCERKTMLAYCLKLFQTS